MKASNSSENKNFFSRCCTFLSTLFSFNNVNCCESRVDEVRMVAVDTDKNSRGSSGNAENSTTAPTPTSQPETSTPQSTPQSIDCRFFKNKINFIGITDDSYDVSNSKKLIEIREMHKRLIFSESPMTRGLYTPTSSLNSSPDSSPQPLTKTSAPNPLIFIHGPNGTNILAG